MDHPGLLQGRTQGPVPQLPCSVHEDKSRAFSSTLQFCKLNVTMTRSSHPRLTTHPCQGPLVWLCPALLSFLEFLQPQSLPPSPTTISFSDSFTLKLTAPILVPRAFVLASPAPRIRNIVSDASGASLPPATSLLKARRAFGGTRREGGLSHISFLRV